MCIIKLIKKYISMNIDPNNTDPFYRYKMPIPIVTTLKGNTLILNTKNIAKSLNRPILFIKTFFSYHFNTSCTIKGDDEVLELKGIQPIGKILEGVYKFIELYILCKCGNPETIYKLSDHKDLSMECLACGNTNVLKEDRLTKFIKKNFKDVKNMYAKNEEEVKTDETKTEEKPHEKYLNPEEFIGMFSERTKNLDLKSFENLKKFFNLFELMAINYNADVKQIVHLLHTHKIIKKSIILKFYSQNKLEFEENNATEVNLTEKLLEVRKEILAYFEIDN